MIPDYEGAWICKKHKLERGHAKYGSHCYRCSVETIEQLKAELNTAKEDKGRLREALQNLYDEQNGVPLLHHETAWEAVMDEAEKLLTFKGERP